jgi:hypothetical protein
VGNPRPAHQTPTNWLNPNAFALPANFNFAYGNEPQRMTQLREGATKNIDLSVAKYFGPEKFRARFGAEFLNAFNHPIYNSIDTCLNCGGQAPGVLDPNFGRAFGTRNDPRNIQLSLKLMF